MDHGDNIGKPKILGDICTSYVGSIHQQHAQYIFQSSLVRQSLSVLPTPHCPVPTFSIYSLIIHLILVNKNCYTVLQWSDGTHRSGTRRPGDISSKDVSSRGLNMQERKIQEEAIRDTSVRDELSCQRQRPLFTVQTSSCCVQTCQTYQSHLWFQDTSRGVPVTNKITNSI